MAKQVIDARIESSLRERLGKSAFHAMWNDEAMKPLRELIEKEMAEEATGKSSPEEFLGRAIDVVLLARGTAFPRGLAEGARVVEVSPGLELPGPGVAASAHEIARILRRR